MQMKVQKGAGKLNAAKMRALLVQENEFITSLLAINDVPDSIHGMITKSYLTFVLVLLNSFYYYHR